MIFNKYNSHKTANKTGTIIILNGPSASGKSSIQKALQDLFLEPYLSIGIDNFFVGLLPKKYIFGGAPISEDPQNHVMKGVLTHDKNQLPIFTLEIGPAGKRIMAGMHRAIAAYAQQGNNLIVDYIVYTPALRKDLVQSLQGLRVYLIGINLPLAILEEREKERATSPIGHARSHYATVHEDLIYDLEINTAKMSVTEAAQAIKTVVETQQPTAFAKL